MSYGLIYITLWEVVITAKLCANFAFFKGRMHFARIAAPLYAKWLNTDWTSYGSLWLPRHSTVDLLVNSVSSKALQLHSWWSLVSSQLWPHTPLRHALQQYKSSQWRAEPGQWQNKRVSCHNFRTMRQYFFTLKSYPCTLWLAVPCLWMKFTFTYFSEER